MKVSIITVCFNSENTIEDTIKSVLNQDYEYIEYIIIDGNSKDETLDIINRYSKSIDKLISEPDKGIYDAMNKGVANCTGDLIGILNSDDFYADSSVISDIVKEISKNESDSIYADLVYVDQKNTSKIVRKWISGDYHKGSFLKGWMPPHPTFFLKKSVYDRYGDYSLELKSAADYELMLRMIHKQQISVSYLPRIITKMRMGGESNVSLKNRIRANKEDRLAWKMNDLKPNPLTLIRKPLSKIFQFIK